MCILSYCAIKGDVQLMKQVRNRFFFLSLQLLCAHVSACMNERAYTLCAAHAQGSDVSSQLFYARACMHMCTDRHTQTFRLHVLSGCAAQRRGRR